MRKRKKNAAIMLRYVFIFFSSFEAANGRYFLFHLRCHVQRALSTLNLAHIDKKKHISITSLAIVWYISFYSFHYSGRFFFAQPIERMQHIQFQICLLSILFEFAIYFPQQFRYPTDLHQPSK